MSRNLVARAVAIDLGGTWLKCAIVNENGHVESVSRTATSTRGREAVLDQLCGSIREATESAGGADSIDAIGVGSPGMISDSGFLNGAAVNIAGWNDFDLGGELSTRIGRRVLALNDANAAAMGELVFGAGRGCESIALISAGTGIGVGIVVHGRPYAGTGGVAGEIGHLQMIPEGRLCSCGNRGCIEAYASARGVIESAREYEHCFSDSESRLAREVRMEAAGGAAQSACGGPALSAERVYRFLVEDDPLAWKAHESVCGALAYAAAVLAVSVAPQRVLFGGGVMGSADVILPLVRSKFSKLILPHVAASVGLESAGLRSDAGLIGVAAAAFAA